MKTKVCSKCKIDKPHSEYFRDNKRAIGIRCKCKECCKQDVYAYRDKNRGEYNSYAIMWRAKNTDKRHASEIKHNYGMSLEAYNALLVAQDYGCKICGKKHAPNLPRKRLYVDHCHASGKIRGLLCSNCNSGIGQMDDRIDLLEKAIAYLKEHGKT